MSLSNLTDRFVMGTLLGTIAFPVTHPLELLRIRAQAYPERSTQTVVNLLFKEKGFLGLTDTALTNFPRRILRESVRWPFISVIHNALLWQFPSYFKREGLQAEILTGVSVALFESLFVLPLEQLMVYRIKEHERYNSFFQKRFSKAGIRSLYSGLGVNFIRQGALWMSVIALNRECKRRFDAIDEKRAHPLLRQAATSFVIASGLTAWVLPIDFVKTKIQMEPELQQKSIVKVTRQLLHRHPLGHFYAGSSLMFVHTLFYATFSGIVLDRLLAKR